MAIAVATGLVALAACGNAAPNRVQAGAPPRALGPVSVAANVQATRVGPCSLPASGIAPANGCPGGTATIGGCSVFPADNPWNQRVDSLPVRADSANYIAAIQNDGRNNGGPNLHLDFYSDPTVGIPVEVVPANQPLVPITYTAYGNESDPGPFPIPPNAAMEGNGAGDSHVLVVRQGECVLYELYYAHPDGHGGWTAQSGARWPLNSNALRPLHWTSADAAGLPIMPGLARYEEVAAGHIDHALRFTVTQTQNGFILPATHAASTGGAGAYSPPMGMRLRLKASFDRSGFDGQARVILDALAKYGMIVADNGSNWYISGKNDGRWSDPDLHRIYGISGDNFEVVDTGPIQR